MHHHLTCSYNEDQETCISRLQHQQNSTGNSRNYLCQDNGSMKSINELWHSHIMKGYIGGRMNEHHPYRSTWTNLPNTIQGREQIARNTHHTFPLIPGLKHVELDNTLFCYTFPCAKTITKSKELINARFIPLGRGIMRTY